jgi:hypothetical protein
MMYLHGDGVAQDYKEAVKWFRLAADQKDPMAQSVLGAMYRDGQGVIQDYEESAKWFRLAAEKGDADAQYELGVAYEEGKGVIQDLREAVKWIRLSAEQGYALAQENLGFLYVSGQGVRLDIVRAYMWFSVAAPRLIRTRGDTGSSSVVHRAIVERKIILDFNRLPGSYRILSSRQMSQCLRELVLVAMKVSSRPPIVTTLRKS